MISSRISTRLYTTCIVGTGPSAFYTVKYLLSSPTPPSHITLLDTSPCPFGLIRSGVAPDHQDVKNAVNEYTTVYNKNAAKLSLFGNVTVSSPSNPSDLTVADLQARFTTVILSYGCQKDRHLDLPYIDAPTNSPVAIVPNNLPIFPSRSLVNFYNGHPVPAPPLPATFPNVVVIGAGNVSLDVSRVLLKSANGGLLYTDAPTPAITALHERTQSGVAVNVVARRGIGQLKFGIKELREIWKESLQPDKGYSVAIDSADVERGMNEATSEEVSNSRPKTRLMKLYNEIAAAAPLNDPSSKSQLQIKSLLNPVAYLLSGDALVGVRCRPQVLTGPADNQLCTDDTAQPAVDLPADLVVLSLGYVSEPLHGMEPHYIKGGYAHEGGFVSDNVFVSGWVKRGATGIVGTNIACAKDTVRSVLARVEEFEEIEEQSRGVDATASELSFQDLLAQKGVEFTTWEGWEKIDAVETNKDRLRTEGQPREKVTYLEELIEIAKA